MANSSMHRFSLCIAYIPDGLSDPLVSVDAPVEDAGGDPVEELQVGPGPLLHLLFPLLLVPVLLVPHPWPLLHAEAVEEALVPTCVHLVLVRCRLPANNKS